MRRSAFTALLLFALAAGCAKGPDTAFSDHAERTPAPAVPSTGTSADPSTHAGVRTDPGVEASSRAETGASATTSTPDAVPATRKVCGLTLRAEAESLTHIPLGKGVEGPDYSPQCTYTSSPSGPVAQVQIFVGEGAKKIYDIDRTLHHRFTSFPGAGDEAHYEDNAAFFRKDTTWVAITLVLLNDPAGNREPLQVLARKAAERL